MLEIGDISKEEIEKDDNVDDLSSTSVSLFNYRVTSFGKRKNRWIDFMKWLQQSISDHSVVSRCADFEGSFDDDETKE
jgi:hypothetical protein